ncbi:universal stress protein [Acuticoccus mangrovi]|uniref:Universal stress protein n=1 Tax=Acuticoccus mangrovi TaxID=2796142 RepID=A0A934IR95_9HYPH|nr:universal stress protein [Acuticoccus mangrovi]MBJ3776595.1 universal stress protein [Acuticoccus mangrovi]
MARIKTILVLVAQGEEGGELLSEAAALAVAREAHLVALTVGLEPTPAYSGLPDIPMDGYFMDLETVRQELKDTVAWMNERLAPTGASFEVRGIIATAGAAGVAVARQARYADLVILPRADSDGNWHQLVDAALFESGRPVILWPRGASLDKIGARVLIAWDAGAEAARAVGGGLDIIAGAEDVRVVTIDPRVGADSHGEEPGADLATMLARHGLPVTVDAIPRENRSVAEAILHHAKGMGADVIVAGAYGHSRLGEIILGGPTRDLMDATDRPLLMAH